MSNDRMTETLPELIHSVVLEVSDFVQEACNIQADLKNFEPWKKKMKEMMHNTRLPNYICEDNLVVLMNWQLDISKLWTDLLTSFRSEKRDEYNNLQMQMHSIISRMQLKILLQRLKRL